MLERRLPRPKPPQPTLAQPEAPCTDFAGSLRQALSPLVSERSLSLALAAEIAGTSERSLRRRLAEEGTSWRQIFDAIRLDACLPVVRDTAVPLHEIAQTLGYSDHAHFTRAFHRWTGQTPSAFRKRARHEPPLPE
jgi:AraC-like DNA-binding protein